MAIKVAPTQHNYAQATFHTDQNTAHNTGVS